MSIIGDQNINARRLKSISSPPNFQSMFFTCTSESVARFMVEKFISLAVTRAHHTTIINQIPDYCFEKLKETLQTYTEIQFIAYDRDDLEPSNQKSFHHPKSAIDKDEKLLSFDSNNNKEQGEKMHNLNISAIGKNHKHDKMITKYFQSSSDKSDSLEPHFLEIEKNEKIDVIEKVETYTFNLPKNQKLRHIDTVDLLLPQKMFYDTTYEGVNDWDILPQPSPVEIDRDASSVIKTDKIVPPEKSILDNQETTQKDEKKTTTAQTMSSTHKRKFNYNPGYVVQKKKPRVPIEFPSYDIPQEKLFGSIETEDINTLREEVEKENKLKELEYRKKLKAQQETLEKMKEKQNKQKELEYKNITVDSKGNIVQIKPVLLEYLAKEFTNADSKTAEIERIEGADPQKNKKGPIKVEKNPYNENAKNIVTIKENQVIQNVKDLLSKTKGVKGIHPVPGSPGQGAQNPKVKEKIEFSPKKDKKPIIPGGSSFDKIKLEVGVSFQEDTKYKTGGKDFFKKFKRYSIENFEKQLGMNMKSPSKKQPEKKEEAKIQFTEQPQQSNYYTSNFANTEPSSMNNTLHLKTKNLKIAMRDLDLITEEEENEMQKKFNQTKPNNLFLNTHKELNTETTYDDMDRFAKTLLGSSEWGKTALKFKKELGYPRQPVKPIKKEGLNVRLPRSRLHIQSKPVTPYATTTTGFFHKKKRLSPLGKETKEFIKVLENEDKDEFARTTTDKLFAKNKLNAKVKK